MRAAILETERRREKQHAYNKAHGITPKSVKKAVHNVMEGAYAEKSVRGRLFPKRAVKEEDYFSLSPEALSAKIAKLENQMYEHAHHLEFEEAAALRDFIRELREKALGR